MFRDIYKVNSNKYICAYPAEVEGDIIFCGFFWVVSDDVVKWIFTGNSSADDELNAPPPNCLLPKPGMASYQSLAAYGKNVDPEYFRNIVVRQC